MPVLKRHEARYLWQNRPPKDVVLKDARGYDAAVIWHEEVPKIKSGAPQDEIPIVFDFVMREDREWFIKGTKLYFDRRLALQTMQGETVLENNDDRLCPIGFDNYEFWVSDL